METKRAIVVKIGSSVLITRRRRIDQFQVHRLACQVAKLVRDGVKVALVVSGAVSLGLGCGDKAKSQIAKQCAAGIGWPYILRSFDNVFKNYGLRTAQMLFTRSLFLEDAKRKKILQVFLCYFKRGVVPIINENDVVDLYSFSGNDFLAFEVARLVKAQKLVILSSHRSYFGYGGGETKEEVIKKADKIGLDAEVADGKKKDVLFKLL